MFTSAVESALIPRSPVRGIRLPRIATTEMRFLSPSEVTDLANAIDPRYHALIVTAAYTGLRWGELAALHLDNLNLLRRSLTVTHTLTEVEGLIHRGEPKTPASRRQVALSPTIADLIGHHIGTYPDPNGFVFTSPDLLPLRGTNFRLPNGSPPSATPSANPADSTTSGTPTPPSSSPKENTPKRSPHASATPPSEPSSTCTGTSLKDSTKPPPTASTSSQRNISRPRRGLASGNDRPRGLTNERNPLQHKGFRWWR